MDAVNILIEIRALELFNVSWNARCRACGGQTGSLHETPAEAAEAWNTRSRLSRPSTVAVKALEWNRRNADGSIHIATALPGEYWAWELAGLGYWSWGSLVGREVYGGIEGAKEYAQADYEQRIRSALNHPSPQGGAEPADEIEMLRARHCEATDYSIDLQRIIEALCKGREIPEPKTTARFHYDMAVAARTHPIGETADGPEPVAVKALEWIEYGNAKTPFGNYTVGESASDDQWHWTFHSYPYGTEDDTPYLTEATAKAAAQRDYETRIRSAITHPVPADGPADAALGLRGISKETQDALDAIDANIRNAALNAHKILVGVPADAVSEADDGWQPIETLPTDETIVEVKFIRVERWNAARFTKYCGEEAASWRALEAAQRARK